MGKGLSDPIKKAMRTRCPIWRIMVLTSVTGSPKCIMNLSSYGMENGLLNEVKEETGYAWTVPTLLPETVGPAVSDKEKLPARRCVNA